MRDPVRDVWHALEGVLDPEIRRPLTELDMVRDVHVDDQGNATLDLVLTIVGCPAAHTIERDARRAIEAVPGITSVTMSLSVMTPDERRALTARLRGSSAERRIPFDATSLTQVIAVTSGKGGVGKSSVTANIAVALAKRGLTVGIMDVDIHGFSIPGLMGLLDENGLAQRPTRVDDMILPPVAFGVKVISIGMFLDSAATAVAWRGPMLHRTIEQFLRDVYFGDLDVLLLDLPPGTGDVAISVGQLLPHAEVLVITTPQDSAAEVAERSGTLAQSAGQNVIGVIENMAGFTQPDGSILTVFGSGGGAKVADRLSAHTPEPVPLLGSIPLSIALRSGGDDGRPVVLSDPTDPSAIVLDRIADGLAHRRRGLAGRRLNVTVS